MLDTFIVACLPQIYGQIFADNERQSVLGKALVLVLFFIVTGMGTITWSKLASGLVMSVFNAFFRTPIPPRVSFRALSRHRCAVKVLKPIATCTFLNVACLRSTLGRGLWSPGVRME